MQFTGLYSSLIGNYQCNSTTDAHSREQEGDHFQTWIAPPEESQLKDAAEDTSSHRTSRSCLPYLLCVLLPSSPIVC